MDATFIITDVVQCINITQLVPMITDILKKISDDKTLTLFNIIAVSGGDKCITLKKINLTSKQYYSRVSGLLNAGLVRRHKGKYSITLLGRIVYDAQMIIGKTLAYYWKLKAIESIEKSSEVKLTREELTQLVITLIDNQSVKDVLINGSWFNAPFSAPNPTTMLSGSNMDSQKKG
jgi:hypothetical protein